MKLSNFIADYPQFEAAAKSLVDEYCESYQLKNYMQAFKKRRNANDRFERDTGLLLFHFKLCYAEDKSQSDIAFGKLEPLSKNDTMPLKDDIITPHKNTKGVDANIIKIKEIISKNPKIKQKQIAEMIGKSQGYVSNIIRNYLD